MTSTIKVNNIQNQCGANIINESSNTITIGASGDTVTLASGASQTGFGRTGTVDWQTGDIKTATFTAANGEGYFANTSSSAFTMNLPSGTAGNIVSVVDYTNTFQTNALTITPNGSQKIGGVNANFIANTEGQSLTFVYVDDTEGWKNVQDSTSNAIGNPNIVATGGTITTCGDCKIHTFTGPGTFTVTNLSTTPANNTVSYLVVAGGGSGGAPDAGGGGAGGYREVKTPVTPYTASPLDGYPSAPNRITVTATSFPITVGGGGAAIPYPSTSSKGNNGTNSVFSTITSAGGGGGGANVSPAPGNKGQDGGSGGGGGRDGLAGNCAGAGNTPPVSPPQGNNGGNSPPGGWTGGGGGGGAGAAGTGGSGGTPSTEVAGNGGNGVSSSISGSSVARGGGGGGSAAGQSPTGAGLGGSGGGGVGSICQPSSPTRNAGSGTANTGGGGGGAHGSNQTSGNGGSGVVIIRYKYQ